MLKTEFDVHGPELGVRQPDAQFSQVGIESASLMARKHHGGYLSEAAMEGSLVCNHPNPRSHTSAANKTMNTTYGIQQSVHRGKEKVRGGSLSFSNHKYNASAGGMNKRGATAPHGPNRAELGLNYTAGFRPNRGEVGSTIPGGIRQTNNVSSDMMQQQVL